MRTHLGRVSALPCRLCWRHALSAERHGDHGPSRIDHGSTSIDGGPATSTTSTGPIAPFPTATFAAMSGDPVTEETAAEFQTILEDGGRGRDVGHDDHRRQHVECSGGHGRWVLTIQIDDQFAIARVTKSIVAAQVMQLVEAGDLSLDDPADEHLPADLDVDTNQATIRHLLSHRSGFRDPFAFIYDTLTTDRQHVWTLSEVLEITGGPGSARGLGVRVLGRQLLPPRSHHRGGSGRPLAQVLRDGVLAIDGVERLVYQPDERPSQPMAMPAGESTDALELGGGYLSSIAGATAGGPAGAMASDSPSLARWWRAFCAGEIVSPDSLAQMAAAAGSDDDGFGYGLGVFNVAGAYGPSVGHAGVDYGFASWAGCLPEQGAVVVALTNGDGDAGPSMALPLVAALSSD